MPPTTIRDPCVFQDDDGSYYIIFGTYEYFIAKLNPDMISLAEQPRYLTVSCTHCCQALMRDDDSSPEYMYIAISLVSCHDGCP